MKLTIEVEVSDSITYKETLALLEAISKEHDQIKKKSDGRTPATRTGVSLVGVGRVRLSSARRLPRQTDGLDRHFGPESIAVYALDQGDLPENDQ